MTEIIDIPQLDLNASLNADHTVFKPSDQCFEWAVQQHIIAYNNIETWSVIFVAGAILLIYGFEFCMEHERFRKHAPVFIYLAKLCLYFFAFIYIMVFKLGLIRYISG